MRRSNFLKSVAMGSASVLVLASAALADDFNIPGGDLSAALSRYSVQTGVALIVSADAIKGVRSRGAEGELTADVALSHILSGTGFKAERHASGAIAVVHEVHTKPSSSIEPVVTLAQAATKASAAAGIESVVVTSSKIKGDIQTVPIAITALSQEQLTSRQIAGGPDLVKEVPNLTFSKTNFSGYNLQIRGIGTQAISVTTDPAVAVAFNDTPFIRNHFFEQEFYDVGQVEILRGPQGTLYGRNATAGVVNVVSAKPTDQFESMLSADIGNYHNRRFEGMINIPIVGDTLDLRVAGEWTKRDGYSFNETTNAPIDGRDLWSTRVTLGWNPVASVQTDLIWEHFQENDDRLRSGKQLCKTDPGPNSFLDANGDVVDVFRGQSTVYQVSSANFSQGCLPTSMYSPDAFEVVNGFSLGFISGGAFEGFIGANIDPYTSTTQSTNLRHIQSALEPKYLAKNDTLEFNASWNVTPALTLYSDSGYNNDYLWSSEDYNRFDTTPGIFIPDTTSGRHLIDPVTKVFCDPQLGCSDRLVVQDLSTEGAWQLSQEFRLASNFTGPLNFSAGGNVMHYETTEKYYVFSNTLTILSLNNVGCGRPYVPNVTDDLYCLNNGKEEAHIVGGTPTEDPQYVDPNPITSLDDQGHNYFLSKNPYTLNSYAAFGETYFDVTPELKLTAGLRWTDDEKHFPEYPSRVINHGYGIQRTGAIDQKWNKWTGRFVANWSPKLDFTDQSMFYASYGRGYKAGGANPPPAELNSNGGADFPVHPLTFEPEFINAYEAGTKNTLLDGGLTLNGDVFFYDYKGYQISQIVDRTSVNLNFDATVRGAEVEATWEPLAGLKFSFAGGYEDTRIKDGQFAIDLMDRTAGVPGWTIMKPWAGEASNCVFPDYVAAALALGFGGNGQGNPGTQACGNAYNRGLDPVTNAPYKLNPGPADYGQGTGTAGIILAGRYPGFDPLSVDPAAPANVNNGLGLPPNNGEGFAKPVGGNELPNAPHYTVSLTGDYTMPVSDNWAATLHSDFYWQSQSFARVFNDRPYDKIRGYSNVNTALILTDASGWQVMGYIKNIFNATAITGDFLNSDDTGLTTNIFLTDPRLYGIRVTKHFDDDGSQGGGFDLFSNSDADDKRPQLWLEVGGDFSMLKGDEQPYEPYFAAQMASIGLPVPGSFEKTPSASFDWESKLTYQPEDSDWVLKAGIRYGRSSKNKFVHKSLPPETRTMASFFSYHYHCATYDFGLGYYCSHAYNREFVDAHVGSSEKHAIIDFTLGKDIGIGMFGEEGTSTLSAGVRIAEFKGISRANINSDPNYYFGPDLSGKYHQNYHMVYEAISKVERSFRGIGPEISWEGSNAIFGDINTGQVAIDWGVNAGVLFGRQRMHEHHASSQCRVNGGGELATCGSTVTTTGTTDRSRRVTVPNLGGYAGLSVNYSNAKVSFGYRADEFFGAMDGGQATAKKYDRGFYGPYLNLSMGFGG